MARRPSSSTNRAARRLREGGSATLESIVALGFFVTFFALEPYGHAYFSQKYDMQARTRMRALDATSRNCVSGARAEEFDPGDSNADAQRVAAESGDNGAVTATQSTMNTVQANDTRVVRRGPFSTRIDAESHGLCNDPPNNTSVQTWVENGAEKSQGVTE